MSDQQSDLNRRKRSGQSDAKADKPRSKGQQSGPRPGKDRPAKLSASWRQAVLEPNPPPGLVARLAAAAILADVLVNRHALDGKLAGNPPLLNGLTTRDRALARSIVTVAMRRLGTLRTALSARMKRGWPQRCGDLEWILITAAAQILFLDTADHAAVDLAVRLVRNDPRSAPYCGLANAVLRSIARSRGAILAASDPLGDDTPAWLATRWRTNYGLAAAAAIAQAHRNEPPIDISVKSDPHYWATMLGGMILPNGSVRLATHEPVQQLPNYSDGEWWVQDAAASLPARLLHPQPGERVADLCAAPGGKTAQLILTGAAVTAVERSPERSRRLMTNLRRLNMNAEIVVTDVNGYHAAPFDAVLLDAPCSATGTIRRHPDVAWTRHESDIARLSHRQSQLLDRAVALLRPGGRLVYCTCSLEPEEGIDQITSLLRRYAELIRMPIDPSEIGNLDDCVTADGDLRTLPFHLPHASSRFAGLSGFFAARLRRRG
jgi:16S rRNA (cytosine967-C5)-methyltransferase